MCDKETATHFEEIKEMLYQTNVKLARMDLRMEKNDKDHEELKPLLKEHEKRLEEEEKFSNQIKGGLKLIGIFLSLGLLKYVGGGK